MTYSNTYPLLASFPFNTIRMRFLPSAMAFLPTLFPLPHIPFVNFHPRQTQPKNQIKHMKTQHTLGPWHTVINMDQSNRRDILAQGDSNGIFIASNANEANARLISAAPDLLSALELLLDKLNVHFDEVYNDNHMEIAMEKAHKAIHKAKY
jgi:hypothetical protein